MSSRNRFNKEPREPYQFPGGVSNYKRDAGSRARSSSRKGRAAGAAGAVGARGSGLNWSEDGRPYIEDGGRRVFAGDAASRYEESPEAAIDNAENLEDTSFYTGKETATVTGRDEVRDSGTGTRTGPAPSKFDGTEGMDAFISKLQGEYGITFGGQGGRTPMESVSLPDTSTGKMVSITNGANSGKYVSVNDPNFDAIVRGDKKGGSAGQQTTGGGVEEITTTKTGGATTGRMGDALGDKSGMRSYMDRVIKKGRENPSDEGPMAYANDGLDARSRAFLDYDGPGGSLMALRAADASQNTVYAGGKLYDVSGKNSKGKYDTIGSEMRGYLKENRNEQAGGQAYKDYYQNNVLTTEDSKSPDSVAPGYSSRADYQQLSQRDMEGTLVMGPDNKPEPFERNVNQSYITGSPGQDIYNTTNNPFVDRQEPPTTGFLPDEETAETIKRFYI